VDLPQPDRPSSTTRSPVAMLRLQPRRTGSPRPWYRNTISCASITVAFSRWRTGSAKSGEPIWGFCTGADKGAMFENLVVVSIRPNRDHYRKSQGASPRLARGPLPTLELIVSETINWGAERNRGMTKEIVVPFVQAKQHNKSFFLTALSAPDIVSISYVARRGVDEEEGAVQRLLNPARIAGIRDFLLAGEIFPVSTNGTATVQIQWMNQ
jgi:hypothetical protein